MQSPVESKLLLIEAVVTNIQQEVVAISDLALQRLNRKTETLLPRTPLQTTPTPQAHESTRQIFKRKCVFASPTKKQVKVSVSSTSLKNSPSEVVEEEHNGWVSRAESLCEGQTTPEAVFGRLGKQTVDLLKIFPESKRNYARQSVDCWTPHPAFSIK